jgi:hypothetical protein
MSAICVPIHNEPAAATSPASVSINGRPAATSEPNASTRIAIVTGQENSSDFIIAVLFSWSKSDHMPAEPARSTRTPGEPSAASGPLSSSAARTMPFALRAAPAWITAVRRSREIAGGSTVATAGSRFSLASTAPSTRSGTVASRECTTTVRA